MIIEVNMRMVVATFLVVMMVGAKKTEGVRAFFVFGDSLVDSGNNNYLPSIARADSPPYGIDFPSHRPTGRFSNGFNLPDLISQRIGSEPLLPYLNPELNGEKLLVGANFASAGTGILNDTGVQFVKIIRMFEQFALFEQYQERLIGMVGTEEAQRVVNGALFLMTLGGNDFVNNYFFVPFSLRSRQFSIPDFCHYLISEYQKILMRLHELGARRVLVTGTGPIGCAPSQLATKSHDGECVPALQEAAQIFNTLLLQMATDLNTKLSTDVFVVVNAFQMNTNFITDPQKFGFVTSKIACCGQGPYNGLGVCTHLSSLCPNRDIYVFWDAFHPSQRALGFIVDEMFKGASNLMTPMNLSTIIAMDSKM